MHGGGFYNMVKYLVAPARMPAELTWFKWEAYATWISGFALVVAIYYVNAGLYLDRSRRARHLAGHRHRAQRRRPGAGVDRLRRAVPLPARAQRDRAGGDRLRASSRRWRRLSTRIFSARGAFMQMGALIGTIMAANVLMVIIPGQRKVVADLIAGRTPDPVHGRRGKQRSTHNNYLTLPVVFVMISGHYPLAYATRWSWVIFALLLVMGGVIRHFFNVRHQGRPSPWWTWGVAVACGLAIVWLSTLGPAQRERPRAKRAEARGHCARHVRAGGGHRRQPLQHVPCRRAGVARHLRRAQGRDAGHASAHQGPCPRDRGHCGMEQRHAAIQRDEHDAGGAATLAAWLASDRK